MEEKNLEERLNQLINASPQEYTQESIERVRRLLAYEAENPGKHKRYRFLQALEDYRLYYALHPEWAKQSTAANGVFRNFYRALDNFIRTTSDNPEEYSTIELLRAPRGYGASKQDRATWVSYLGRTFEDWKQEYLSHPEWKESSLRTNRSFRDFYLKFNRWLNTTIQNNADRIRLRGQLFPKARTEEEMTRRYHHSKRYNPSSRDVHSWKREYESHPEWRHFTITSKTEKAREAEYTPFYWGFKEWLRGKSETEKTRLMKIVYGTEKVRLSKARRKYSYKTNKNIDDWKREYESHPEWPNLYLKPKSGKNKKQSMGSGLNSFYHALNDWLRRNITDPKERTRLRTQVINLRVKSPAKDYSSFKNRDDWKREYESHPEWPAKSLMDVNSGLHAFYNQCLGWLNKNVANGSDKASSRRYIFGIRTQGSRSDREYQQLKSRLNKLTKTRGKKRTVTDIGVFFGLGKCFEYFIGAMLATSCKEIEHQYKIPTQGSFRIADFFVKQDSLEEIIEVKSGEISSPHDREQLEDLLLSQDQITYIFQDKTSTLAMDVAEIAQKHNRIIKILSLEDLTIQEEIKQSPLAQLFFDKEKFKQYAQEKDIGKLERDIFSIYTWIKANQSESPAIIDVLEAAYEQDKEFQELTQELLGIRWLTAQQYHRETTKVYTPGQGRHFDLELAKTKLRAKINQLEEENHILDKGYEDYKKRRENFETLRVIVKGIPEKAADFDIPPLIFQYNPKDAVLLHRNNGTTKRFEVQLPSHRRMIEQWVKDGKIVRKKEKFISLEGAIQV